MTASPIPTPEQIDTFDMIDALWPPDPTRDGRYWLQRPDKTEAVGRWQAAYMLWTIEGRTTYVVPPVGAAEAGYTLTSRHQITTAAQLDALWRMTAERQPGWSAAGSYERGRQAGIAEANTKLRAVLKGDAP